MRPPRAYTNARLAALARVLGDHLTSRARLDLLVFLGRYWGGWHDRRAIDPLGTCSGAAIYEALDSLVDEGVIQTVQNGRVTYYRLTTDYRVRASVIELSGLRRTDRRLLFRRCIDRNTSASGEAYATRRSALSDPPPPETGTG